MAKLLHIYENLNQVGVLDKNVSKYPNEKSRVLNLRVPNLPKYKQIIEKNQKLIYSVLQIVQFRKTQKKINIQELLRSRIKMSVKTNINASDMNIKPLHTRQKRKTVKERNEKYKAKNISSVCLLGVKTPRDKRERKRKDN